MAKVPQECLNYDFIETLKDLLIDVIIEKEKSGYIIGKFGKSKPNSGDRHSKMETTHKLILCYVMLTLT